MDLHFPTKEAKAVLESEPTPPENPYVAPEHAVDQPSSQSDRQAAPPNEYRYVGHGFSALYYLVCYWVPFCIFCSLLMLNFALVSAGVFLPFLSETVQEDYVRIGILIGLLVVVIGAIVSAVLALRWTAKTLRLGTELIDRVAALRKNSRHKTVWRKATFKAPN